MLEKILTDIEQYIKIKHSSKKWEAGKDWVQYAGPFFDDKEYVAAVKSLLNEWIVLGRRIVTGKSTASLARSLLSIKMLS